MRLYEHAWSRNDTVFINDERGFCKINIYKERHRIVGEFYDLVVYPEYRGNGFGHELLDKAIEVAKSKECNFLVLWPDCEDWVRDWYSRNGFKENEDFLSFDGRVGWSKLIKNEL